MHIYTCTADIDIHSSIYVTVFDSVFGINTVTLHVLVVFSERLCNIEHDFAIQLVYSC